MCEKYNTNPLKQWKEKQNIKKFFPTEVARLNLPWADS